MNILLVILILSAPFALAALLSWASHRSEFMRARLFGEMTTRDYYRVEDDALRTHFAQHPSWPVSGVLGERR
ncbi:MAG: hypothetical protein ABW137_20560 [Mycobacterium sp.]